jgi:hypothetical protein
MAFEVSVGSRARPVSPYRSREFGSVSVERGTGEVGEGPRGREGQVVGQTDPVTLGVVRAGHARAAESDFVERGRTGPRWLTADAGQETGVEGLAQAVGAEHVSLSGRFSQVTYICQFELTRCCVTPFCVTPFSAGSSSPVATAIG